jgi:signal transduction histidine kinase
MKNVVAAVILSSLATFAGAETLAEAKAMLAAAHAEVGAKGMNAAADFNAGGKWKGQKAYVVLVDFKGQMYAHADNNKMVGKNMFEAKDATGKLFVQETIRNVQAGGDSLVELRWANPATKKIDDGKLLARRVPGQDAYVGIAFFE